MVFVKTVRHRVFVLIGIGNSIHIGLFNISPLHQYLRFIYYFTCTLVLKVDLLQVSRSEIHSLAFDGFERHSTKIQTNIFNEHSALDFTTYSKHVVGLLVADCRLSVTAEEVATIMHNRSCVVRHSVRQPVFILFSKILQEFCEKKHEQLISNLKIRPATA